MASEANQELFERHRTNPILSAADLPYAANSVFNAGAALVDGETLLLLRVEDRSGLSHLTVARSRDGVRAWRIDRSPTLQASPATHPEEVWGIEDPRISYLEDQKRWIVAYTAYSGGGPMVSLAATTDFRNLDRLGPMLPPENKDAALFPLRFEQGWALIHRPVPAMQAFGAHIWISFSPDLVHWGGHRMLLRAREGGYWDASKIGLSPPPLLTEHGWLLMYHGVRTTVGACLYRLGLALLDRNNPCRVLKRARQWAFAPVESYERYGDVSNVVFPCGWTLAGDELRLYYGAADSSICLATASLARVLEWLDEHSEDGEQVSEERFRRI